jgi:hypothetical protein
MIIRIDGENGAPPYPVPLAYRARERVFPPCGTEVLPDRAAAICAPFRGTSASAATSGRRTWKGCWAGQDIADEEEATAADRDAVRMLLTGIWLDRRATAADRQAAGAPQPRTGKQRRPTGRRQRRASRVRARRPG